MSTTMLGSTTHPILGFVRDVAAGVKAVAGVQPVFMTTAEKQAALVELARVEAQVAELRLRVLAASDDVAQQTAARDAAAWVSHATQTDPRAATADLHLAKDLDRRELVSAGLREGNVSTAQARVLAPDIAEAELAKKLEAEENQAREKASLKLRRLGDGRTRMSGTLPDAAAARLLTYLDAYTNPRREGHDDSMKGQDPGLFGDLDQRVPLRRRRAWAFMSMLELLDPTRLPEHGGEATTIVVTININQLRADLATASLLDPTGDTEQVDITAAQARRLACNASILPAVLDGVSEVLDLGRAQRLHSKAQRRALRLRDQRCRAEGCTIPAKWTEVHHLKPWSEGGTTDLADGVCLCSHHHHRIHDHTYRHERLPNGDIRFHRRT